MAQETELERLVVRLVGDASSYMQMLKEADAKAKETKGTMESLAGAAAGFMGALGAREFLTEAKSEWMAAETASFKLTSVLKSQGRDVQALSADYAEFASQQQKITTYSDEQVLGLLKLAESFDMTGSAAKSATREAMALAEAGDVSAESAFRIVQAMQKGEVERARLFSRPIMQLRGVKDEDEFRGKYAQLIASGNQGLEDKLKTSAGRAENFGNQWSDTLEKIGQAYTDVANPMKIAKRTAMEFWDSMSEGTQRSVVHIAGWASQITVAITAVTGLNALLPNLRSNLTAVATSRLFIAGAGAVVIANIADELMRSKEEAKELADQLERAASASSKLRGAVGQRVDAAVAANNRPEQERVREMLRQQLEQTEKQRQSAEDELRVFKSGGFGLEAAASKISGAVGGPQTDAFERARSSVANLKAEEASLKAGIDKLTVSIEDQIDALDQFDKKVKDAKESSKKLSEDSRKSLKDMVNDLAGERAGTEAKARGDLYWNDQLEKLAKNMPAGSRLVQFVREYNAETKAMAAAQDVREGLKLPQEKLEEELTRLFDLLQRGKLSWDEYGRAAQAAKDRLLGTAAALTDATLAGTNAARVALYNQEQLLRRPTMEPNLPSFVQQGPMPRQMNPAPELGPSPTGDTGVGVGQDLSELVKLLKDALAGGVRIAFVNAGR